MYLCLSDLFEIELFINIKMDLALNNQQCLVCHKTRPNQTKQDSVNYSYKSYSYDVWVQTMVVVAIIS